MCLKINLQKVWQVLKKFDVAGRLCIFLVGMLFAESIGSDISIQKAAYVYPQICVMISHSKLFTYGAAHVVVAFHLNILSDFFPAQTEGIEAHVVYFLLRKSAFFKLYYKNGIGSLEGEACGVHESFPVVMDRLDQFLIWQCICLIG